jgi:threonine dehydratase
MVALTSELATRAWASDQTHTDLELEKLIGRPVVCKAESLQRTGSFKFRGAYNAVAALCQQDPPRGVVGASSGNHAQALALAGRLLAVPVIVVVPQDAPAVKTRARGPTVPAFSPTTVTATIVRK